VDERTTVGHNRRCLEQFQADSHIAPRNASHSFGYLQTMRSFLKTMTRTTTGVRRTKRLARLGLGIAATIVVVGSAAVPGVLAQTLPIPVAPPHTSLPRAPAPRPR